MTPEQIEQAIGFRLATMPGAVVVVRDNQDADPPRPFIAMAHHPVMRTRPALAGGGFVVDTGYVALSIVTPWGRLGTLANTLAAAVQARFPKALPITVGANRITITDDARITGQGYRDMADWRLPMRIDYVVVH